MSSEDLLEYKKECLVLRNMAQAMLDRIERRLKASASIPAKKMKEAEKDAEILTRLRTGKRK